MNWRNLILVLANIPFALVGGVLAVFAGGGQLSLGAMIGFVTLFGITVRNSTMLLSHYEHLVEVEGKQWGYRTAAQGVSEGLTPILRTVLVTALGLLPLAIGSGAALDRRSKARWRSSFSAGWLHRRRSICLSCPPLHCALDDSRCDLSMPDSLPQTSAAWPSLRAAVHTSRAASAFKAAIPSPTTRSGQPCGCTPSRGRSQSSRHSREHHCGSTGTARVKLPLCLRNGASNKALDRLTTKAPAAVTEKGSGAGGNGL